MKNHFAPGRFLKFSFGIFISYRMPRLSGETQERPASVGSLRVTIGAIELRISGGHANHELVESPAVVRKTTDWLSAEEAKRVRPARLVGMISTPSHCLHRCVSERSLGRGGTRPYQPLSTWPHYPGAGGCFLRPWKAKISPSGFAIWLMAGSREGQATRAPRPDSCGFSHPWASLPTRCRRKRPPAAGRLSPPTAGR